MRSAWTIEDVNFWLLKYFSINIFFLHRFSCGIDRTQHNFCLRHHHQLPFCKGSWLGKNLIHRWQMHFSFTKVFLKRKHKKLKNFTILLLLKPCEKKFICFFKYFNSCHTFESSHILAKLQLHTSVGDLQWNFRCFKYFNLLRGLYSWLSLVRCFTMHHYGNCRSVFLPVPQISSFKPKIWKNSQRSISTHIVIKIFS